MTTTLAFLSFVLLAGLLLVGCTQVGAGAVQTLCHASYEGSTCTFTNTGVIDAAVCIRGTLRNMENGNLQVATVCSGNVPAKDSVTREWSIDARAVCPPGLFGGGLDSCAIEVAPV